MVWKGPLFHGSPSQGSRGVVRVSGYGVSPVLRGEVCGCSSLSFPLDCVPVHDEPCPTNEGGPFLREVGCRRVQLS